ncbi:MAG: metallophosphoesterase family protein [Lachnospiraceae bacterium]|nr:metallophosphoesterase family protein [Lachnospiraceae bacterium]
MKRKVVAALMTVLAIAGTCPAVYASTDHYNDSSVTGAESGWSEWTADWENIAADYTKVSLTPGADETELNFAWYSEKTDSEATPIVHFGTDQAALEAFTGTSGDVDQTLTGDTAYTYNHVTVTGLEPDTTYYYTVEKNGEQSDVCEYKTQSLDSVKILYVGDPQIGASKGQTQNGAELVPDDGAANTAACNDGFAWNRTLTTAVTENPDLNFVISAGDQVNKTGKPKEEEYAAYLNAEALTGLSVATTIGNHDSLNEDYAYHFNNPNATENGTTAAGGDYYYSYGDGLFIVLNTNNYNAAEHSAAIQEAVDAYPDAAWRIVTMHQDIYGSGLDHSDTDGMILRTQLTPIFDTFNIDVVLQGHDHTYSRSKMLYGDGQEHQNYEFTLNEDGSDYDWDHATNTESGEKIALAPEEGDEEAASALAAFQEDNQCYTIEDVEGNTVTDPEGTLYMTANSASGSKYYELISTQQDYIAARSQNWLPSYSVITMDADSFAIDTYQITDDGSVESIDDTFTIEKTGAASESSDTAESETTAK